ncbi:uncharacterized protein BO66DRAFT_355544 [Aspergillus aculeatinus CBS 121060]|uniref:Uncharacterized protein n=1 Tax=Aspergillus aculeatinus CBS 121060 TaxID=1448322 RepID=A0ACD1H0J9_9EURO|nr:hypothetical protein BO66DRAFT_355544 [Aspergillus aculeatinus CBS 121060]RAH67034.1 hypothetical protein BO66DRAFT_355544 [Aspergillus aculeatinus CBS 121060]
MVNWKAPESTDRLLASLIVAHPGLKLDYKAMATAFGQGASYDSIEGRFRKWRKMADELRGELDSRGINFTELRARNSSSGILTPRTPRGPRNGVTKASQPTPSSSRARRDGRTISQKTPTRPAKGGSSTRTPTSHGGSLVQAIFVEDSIEEEDKKDLTFKRESSEAVPYGLITPVKEPNDLMIVDSPATGGPGDTALATTRHGNARSDKRAQKALVPDLPIISGFEHGGHASSSSVGLHHSSGFHPMDDIQQRLHGHVFAFDHLLDSVPSGSYLGGDVV